MYIPQFTFPYVQRWEFFLLISFPASLALKKKKILLTQHRHWIQRQGVEHMCHPCSLHYSVDKLTTSNNKFFPKRIIYFVIFVHTIFLSEIRSLFIVYTWNLQSCKSLQLWQRLGGDRLFAFRLGKVLEAVSVRVPSRWSVSRVGGQRRLTRTPRVLVLCGRWRRQRQCCDSQTSICSLRV